MKEACAEIEEGKYLGAAQSALACSYHLQTTLVRRYPPASGSLKRRGRGPLLKDALQSNKTQSLGLALVLVYLTTKSRQIVSAAAFL